MKKAILKLNTHRSAKLGYVQSLSSIEILIETGVINNNMGPVVRY